MAFRDDREGLVEIPALRGGTPVCRARHLAPPRSSDDARQER